MTVMNKATVNIRNINLGQITGHNTVYHNDFLQCRSNEATSAEVKCSLPSSLINTKSIKSISLNVASHSNPYTIVNLRIDTDYLVASSYLPNAKEKLIHIEGNARFLLASTSVLEYDLDSSPIPNGNVVEVISPPHSCFNLSLREFLTSVSVPFTASGSVISDETGEMIQSIALQGDLLISTLGVETADVTPC